MLTMLLVVFFFVATDPSRAEGQSFSLTDAVLYALEHNHEILADRNAVAAKRDEVGIARSALLPKVFFDERYLRTNNPTYAFMARLNQGRFTQQDFAIDSLNNPNPVDDFQTLFGIEQSLFAPKDWIDLDMARREHDAGSLEANHRKEEVAFQVCQAWLGVHTASALLAVAEKGVEDAAEHLRIATLRYKAELGMVSDTLRASTALAEAKQRKVTAEKQVHLARRGLGRLLGLTESVDVTGQIPDFQPRGLDEYVKTSRNRGDLRSLELRYRNAEDNIRASGSNYLPTIGVGGSWQWNDPSHLFGDGGDSWQISAFLRWNLFDGAKREYELSRAKHQAGQVREKLNEMREIIDYRLYAAQLGLEEAEANLELARQALKTAEEGRRLVQIRYENAFSPIVDLLDAQTVLDRARADLATKENEYRLAVLNLGREGGTILKDLGIAREEEAHR